MKKSNLKLIDQKFAKFISNIVADIDYDIYKEMIWSEKKDGFDDDNLYKDTQMYECIESAKQLFKELGLSCVDN